MDDDEDGAYFPGFSPDDGMPPSWLEGLLDDQDHVVATDPFEAALRSLPQARFPVSLRRVMWGVPTAYFAVVDSFDPSMAMSLHALVTEMEDRCGGAWWTMEDPGWVRDLPQGRPGLRLRWLAQDMVGDVIAGMEAHFRRTRRASRPEALRADMRKAMQQQGGGSLDLDPGYVQWAGNSGGLLLEVGDGNDYTEPLDEGLWADLRWLGWMKPEGAARNAWFAASGPGAPEVGADLVARTLAVLAAARVRRRREAGLDPQPASFPVPRELLARLPELRVGADEPGKVPSMLGTVTPEEGSP